MERKRLILKEKYEPRIGLIITFGIFAASFMLMLLIANFVLFGNGNYSNASEENKIIYDKMLEYGAIPILLALLAVIFFQKVTIVEVTDKEYEEFAKKEEKEAIKQDLRTIRRFAEAAKESLK